jgi:hypothetical protein
LTEAGFVEIPGLRKVKSSAALSNEVDETIGKEVKTK